MSGSAGGVGSCSRVLLEFGAVSFWSWFRCETSLLLNSAIWSVRLTSTVYLPIDGLKNPFDKTLGKVGLPT